MTSPILLVVALAAERRALRRCLQAGRSGRLGDRPMVQGRLDDREVLLLQSGIGRARAHQSVQMASHRFRLQGVWSLGFAGGLVERLKPADLIFPTEILDDAASNAEPFRPDRHHAAACAALRRICVPFDAGRLLTVDAVLRTPQAKRDAHRRTGAIAVDMESAGVCAAAHDLGIPWAVLKSVVDSAADFLPETLTDCTTPLGHSDPAGVFSAFLCGPASWRRVIKIGWAARRAGKSLRRGLEEAFGAWAALTAS